MLHALHDDRRRAFKRRATKRLVKLVFSAALLGGLTLVFLLRRKLPW